MNHQSKPTVFIIATLSADGFIAPRFDETATKSTAPSTAWTSKEETQWFKQKTLEAGVVIMGRTTWETIPPKFRPLPNRLNIIYTSSPQTIPNSVDLEKTDLNAESSKLKPLTTNLPIPQLTDLLKNKLGPKFNLAVCGGCSIYTQFINSGVVDKLYLTHEPILFGQGISLFDKPITCKLNLDQIITLTPQTTVMEYSVINKAN